MIQAVAFALFQLALFVLVPCVTFAAWRVANARRTVGSVIGRARPGRSLRAGGLVALQLAVAAIVVARGDLPVAPALVVLSFGVALAVFEPSSADSVCGEDGVQRGWHARSYAELEEWRLTGDHLRFRLFGEWTAVPLPPDAQARIREKLGRVAPDRESAFKD